ncbi:sensor histidine kinase [Cohnella suwonensis]|uniref:histidine kinase n=1 Tax=Cohnella suwonensis TaxID=696072 RepID=A0ABW0LRM8_9BACL
MRVVYSLRNRLSLIIALLLVISFLAMYVFISRQAKNIIGSFADRSVSETMDQYTFSVNTVAAQIGDFANLMFNSEMTQAWLSAQADPQLSKDEKMLADLKMRQFLTRTTANYSVISSVSVFHRNGISIGIQDQIYREQNFMALAWYRYFKQRGEQWVSAHTDPYQPASMAEVPMISLVFPLGVYNPAQAESVLKVNFRSDLIRQPLEQISLGEKGRVLLVNWDGKPVLAQDDPKHADQIREQLSQIRRNGGGNGTIRLHTAEGNYFLFYRTLKVQDWILIGLISEADLYRKLNNLNTTMLAIIAILLAATVFAATVISAGVVKPLSRLSLAMRQVQKGDFARAQRIVLPAAGSKSEVGFVVSSFLTMIERLERHIQSEFEMNIRRQWAEYKALRMQINPHFLYNTLDVISSLTMQKRAMEAVDVIESLGKMLRFSLNIRNDLVSVDEELLYIERYVSILRIRFSDRLQISMDIDPGMRDCRILKFILQPIVENAVKYSLRNKDSAVIRIQGWMADETLHLRVEDNGVGMPPGMVERMFDEFRRSQFIDVLNTKGDQIGLRNVLARCFLFYGDAFNVSILSEVGQGTSITISMPRKGEADEAV